MTVATTDTAPGTVLEERIRTKSAVVGVIGLGYVGLPLVAGFARAGFRAVGFDVDDGKVASLEANRSYIAHFPDAVLEELHRERRFSATSDFSRLRECDVVLICVPTPLTPHREPDLSFIESTARQIAAVARQGQLVILESTTYPGTTEEILRPVIEARGLVLDRDFFLAFSPEREDPNNASFRLETIPKVVGGVTPRSGDLAARLYGSVVQRVVTVSNARTAEATKLFENIFRAVNIALVNELKICFDRMGIDVWEVLDAASTKPFGFMRFEPGPGLGGHCLAGSETVRVRNAFFNTVVPLRDLFEGYRRQRPALPIQDAEVVLPEDLDALSIDPETGSTQWRSVSYLFKRPFIGEIVEISLDGNRTLRVTDRHPMLVLEGDRMKIREARDLTAGDRVPQFCGVTIGKREDTKRGRHYRHEFSSGQVGYFSSSPELFAQTESLLQGLGFVPFRKKGKPHLRLAGRRHLDRLATLLDGEKRQRLIALAAARVRTASPRRSLRWAGGNALRVTGVSPVAVSEAVYSLEVPGSHTFAATGGIFVHNCIPVDPFYLTWKAREYGVSTRFIELAGEINSAMPAWVVQKLGDALNERGKSLKGSRVLIAGVAYKKDVDDVRESPALEIIEQLLSKGSEVVYHDPHVPKLHKMRRHDLDFASVALTEEVIARCHAVVLVTDHDAIDYALLARASLVVDCRGAFRRRGLSFPGLVEA